MRAATVVRRPGRRLSAVPPATPCGATDSSHGCAPSRPPPATAATAAQTIDAPSRRITEPNLAADRRGHVGGVEDDLRPPAGARLGQLCGSGEAGGHGCHGAVSDRKRRGERDRLGLPDQLRTAAVRQAELCQHTRTHLHGSIVPEASTLNCPDPSPSSPWSRDQSPHGTWPDQGSTAPAGWSGSPGPPPLSPSTLDVYPARYVSSITWAAPGTSELMSVYTVPVLPTVVAVGMGRPVAIGVQTHVAGLQAFTVPP